jgi:hypothetical protein
MEWFPSSIKRRPLAAIDFEASCLPCAESWPIEVAVVHEDGRECSWLVRPEAGWLAGGTWDPASEAVHGISLDTLLATGRPAGDVAGELAGEVAGCCLVSDHSATDGPWLAMLCATGDIDPPHLEDLAEFHYGWLNDMGGGDAWAALSAVSALMETAAARHPARHRAVPDARRLMDFLRAVIAEPAPHGQAPSFQKSR